ncbi:hypothetical protein V6N11_047205 [Hibiscus sabdariffa]|uniref:Uncharacterized protein n=1 Tax=Hibiscus sabdariffa TaxID=183260 RepID=A0ABR2AAX7_9ROSI
MITTFPESRDSPLNPRKHRRLDDEPPDSSDPRGESDKALPTIPKPVDARGTWTIFGSYLTMAPWTEDFSTTQPYPRKPPCNETDAYGPWMVVERRQRYENLSEHTTDTDVPPRSHASVCCCQSSNASSSRPVQPLDRHHHSAVVIPDNDDSSPPINVSSPDVIKCATRHDSMEQDKENHSLPPMMCDNTITTFDPTVLLNTVQ